MFEEFPKIARLSRECVITEKIDGTNAQVHILPFDQSSPVDSYVLATRAALEGEVTAFVMLAGSRTRYITPQDDNHGFAKWVQANAADLWTLGEGRHYGEWWGSGIQRGYGLTKGDKRFSLFNVARWHEERDREKYPQDPPSCCHVVPLLKVCGFDYVNTYVEDCLSNLRDNGSWASPGFMKPEGVVVWHEAARTLFKKTIEGDDEGKEQRARRLARVTA